jgi:ketosteroid isomerase-like protein
MKTLLSLIVLLLPVCSFSQGSAAEIRKLEEQERTAVASGDTATLFGLWSEDYVINNPNNMILTAAQIKKFVRGTGMDKTSFTRNIEKISFMKNIAVVMGSETVMPKDKNGTTGKPVYRRYTNIWINDDNSWKLTARQVTTTLIQ